MAEIDTSTIILEYKQEQEWKKRYKDNHIELNNYFKYSGKIEEPSEEYKAYIENSKEYKNYTKSYNCKLYKETEKYKKIIKKERAENYQKYTKPKRK